MIARRRAVQLVIALALACAAASLGLGAVKSPAAPGEGNGVVHARNWTGDPAHGGSLIATEWLTLGLPPGIETVRVETGNDLLGVADGLLYTRTDVPCTAGSQSSGLCPEERELTPPSADGLFPSTFSRTKGGYLDDPNVRQPSDLQAARLLASRGAAPVASGPLADVLESWQTPPPGHRSTSERFDLPHGAGSEWVDAATHLPLIETIRAGSDRYSSYWTYDPTTIDPATPPADFFLLAPPANPRVVTQDDYYPEGRLPASVRDEATGARFAPFSLGPSATIAGQRLCLDVADLHRYLDRVKGLEDPGDSHVTSVEVNYVLRARGTRCVPGHGDAANPPLQISTLAWRSADAAANRGSFHRTRAIAVKRTRRSLRVYVLPNGPETMALVDIGRSTVLIDSYLPTPKHVPGGAGAQILAVVSRLLG